MTESSTIARPDALFVAPRRLPLSAIVSKGGLFIAWAALTVVFCVLRPETFATIWNFQALFSTQSVLLVLAIGLIAPLICGDLDLSAPATMGIVLMTIGACQVSLGLPLAVSIIIGVIAGLVVGLANVLLVVVVGVDSIVATLGMSTLLTGTALGISILPLSLTDDSLSSFMTLQVGGLQLAFYLAIIACAVLWYFFTQTSSGRNMYVVGASRSTAELSGLPVKRLRSAALMLSAGGATLAAIMFAGLFGSANPTTAPQMLLPALAAVFLGSTAVTPGRFNIIGTFAAVYFLVFGISGLEMLGLSGWISQAFYGGSLIVAVVLSRLGSRRRNSR